jgi:radical SAM protein with 4Fe4S-binding SPASM domain
MNVCKQDASGIGEYFERKLGGRRFPLQATFEITRRCNCRCVHCYLQDTQPGRELSTGEVKDVLDELAAAGCMFLTLTGGEPLTRPDFGDILRLAVRAGFLLTLFTNASLIDDRIADLLADNPPRRVEVSLYGADAATYRAITGSGANLTDSLAGIDRLLARGIEVSLKTVILAPLVGQADGLRHIARERGIPLRLDPGIDPTLLGNQRPCFLRPDPQEAAAVEMDDLDALGWFEKADREFVRAGPCGAGHNSVHIDSSGKLMRCVLLREPAIDLLQTSLAEGFRILGELPRPQLAADAACRECPERNLCSFCPGLARLTKAPGPGSYYCRVARARARLLDACDVRRRTA